MTDTVEEAAPATRPAGSFGFDVVRGNVVKNLIAGSRSGIVDVVRAAYLDHHEGQSVNPRSHFLKFPDKPDARIIALPAYLGGSTEIAGIKWIGSFPANIDHNIPRASAVLVLNDYATGYPIACMEASHISAARTAASAVLGAELLAGHRHAQRVLMVGAGVLGRAVVDFFAATDWKIGELAVYDHVSTYAQALTDHARSVDLLAEVSTDVHADLQSADIVVFVTTAAEPWIVEDGAFRPGQIVLNVSLRDIGPDVIAAAHNVVDDIDHCLNANSSPHLAQQKYGHTDFIDGTIAGLLSGDFTVTADKPIIFSPFGLGILDLAVGNYVYRAALERGLSDPIVDFFADTTRWQ